MRVVSGHVAHDKARAQRRQQAMARGQRERARGGAVAGAHFDLAAAQDHMPLRGVVAHVDRAGGIEHDAGAVFQRDGAPFADTGGVVRAALAPRHRIGNHPGAAGCQRGATQAGQRAQRGPARAGLGRRGLRQRGACQRWGDLSEPGTQLGAHGCHALPRLLVRGIGGAPARARGFVRRARLAGLQACHPRRGLRHDLRLDRLAGGVQASHQP
ncbi:hypothetical protein D9M68_702350 [compost metagenome]